MVRVQDVNLSETSDADILEWAAAESRLLLTHDINPIPAYVSQRLQAGKRMPGVIEVDLHAPIGSVINDMLTLTLCSYEGEWEGQIIYLPFR